MVKKKENHKNNWLIILVTIVALLALILAAIAITKTNMTGDAIRDWFRKKSSKTTTYNGVFGHKVDASSLKGYEVKYDDNGNLIYEILQDRIRFGSNYEYFEDDQGEGFIRSSQPGGGSSIYTQHVECYCKTNGVSGGSCQEKCKKTISGNDIICSGVCSGTGCSQEACSKSVTISYN